MSKHPRPAPSSEDWPTYLHDGARSGNDAQETALSPSTVSGLTLQWSFATGGMIASQPIVVNHTVYIGSYDGYEYALNASTGAKLWAKNLGTSTALNCSPDPRGIISTATVSNGVLYVGSGSQWYYALNVANGSTLWKVDDGNTSKFFNWGSPLVVGNDLYIGRSSGCDAPLVRADLWKVNATTHAVIQKYYVVPAGRHGGSIWGSPTYDSSSNTIFFATGNGEIVNETGAKSVIAIDASTLALRSAWQIPYNETGPDSDFGTTPTLATGASGTPIVVATNKNGVTYAFARSNLSAGPLWTDQVAVGGECPECGQGSVSSAAWDGTSLYVAGGKTSIGNTSFPGSVRAINPTDGSYRWEFGAPGAVIPAITTADGLVIAGAGSILEVLDAATGTLLFNYTTGGVIYGAASVANGCIFASSTDTTLYAFGLAGSNCTVPPPSKHGHSKLTLALPSTSSGPAAMTTVARLSDPRETRAPSRLRVEGRVAPAPRRSIARA
ncbi:MAG: PQQ-binding-like beta-propeller repeat protein [Thermoplasmata archaeon]|nr:PQQ-binding-like beta-propeller repeat protein [Thermoplasmata archaeon]